ncbi:hypothetical protein ACHHYP_12961, partial [Achlya hypogyna]
MVNISCPANLMLCTSSDGSISNCYNPNHNGCCAGNLFSTGAVTDRQYCCTDPKTFEQTVLSACPTTASTTLPVTTLPAQTTAAPTTANPGSKPTPTTATPATTAGATPPSQTQQANADASSQPGLTTLGPKGALTGNVSFTISKQAIAGIAIGAVVVVAIIIYLVCRKRRKQPRASSGSVDLARPINSTTAGTANDGSSMGLDLSALAAWRLEQNEIVGSRTLASGAYGEVSLGSYRGRTVAIKSSLKKKATIADLQCFIDEIKL